MRLSQNRRLIGGGITAIVLVAVGLVYAAWTTNGTGSGYAKATSAEELTTVDVSATTDATLYPGATGDVEIEIANPNDYPVQVTAITGDGTITPDGAHSGCSPTGVTYTNQTGLTINVPANDSTESTLAGAVQMSNAAANACQGATFTIPVALTGESTTP